jgi:hypothetical protein
MITIQEEEVDLSEYTNSVDVQRQIGIFIENMYVTLRLQPDLGYLKPTGFEATL